MKKATLDRVLRGMLAASSILLTLDGFALLAVHDKIVSQGYRLQTAYEKPSPAVLDTLKNKCGGESYTIVVEDYPGHGEFRYDATTGSFTETGRHMDGYVASELLDAITSCVEGKGIKRVTWNNDNATVMPFDTFKALPEYAACDAELRPTYVMHHETYEDATGDGIVEKMTPLKQYVDNRIEKGDSYNPLDSGTFKDDTWNMVREEALFYIKHPFVISPGNLLERIKDRADARLYTQSNFVRQLEWYSKRAIGRDLYPVLCNQ